METGDPGTPGPARDAEGAPPAGWNPNPPAPPPGGWPPPPPPPSPGAAHPGWNPNPPPTPPPSAWPPPPPPPAAAHPGWNPNPAWAPPPPAGAPWGTPPGAVPGWHSGPPGGAAPTGAGAFRPRGVGELLDGAFTLYRRNVLLLVAIAAMVQVPFALIQLLFFELSGVGDRVSSLRDLISSGATQGGLTTDQSSQLTSDLGTAVAYYGLVFVVQYLVVYPLSLAATTSAVSARYLDQPASVGSSYRAALSRWRSIIVLVLSLVLIVAGGVAVSALLAVLTGAVVLFSIGVFAAVLVYVVLLVRTAVGPQSIVLEKLGGLAGIRRSWRLTTGSGWRTFGIVLLLGIIQLVAANVIVLPLDAAIARSDPATQLLVSQVGAAVTAVFIAPITLVTLTLLYYDLRIRREGFDIEMLAASL